MVELNDRIRGYMEKLGVRDIVLNIETITS